MNHVLPAWDVACGLYAAVGLLAAERHRRRTGQGRAITLPLADVALAVTGHLGFLAEGRLSAVIPQGDTVPPGDTQTPGPLGTTQTPMARTPRRAGPGSATTCTEISPGTSERGPVTRSWS